MKTLRLTVLLMMGLLLLPLFAKAEGGGSGNGGGAGLVRTIDGQLQVITVDRWETQFRPQLEGMIPGETPVSYLRRILDTKIRPIEPYFVLRLEEALTQVLNAQWIDVPNLPALKDTGKIKGNYKEAGWKLAQLVVRTSESKKGFRPKVSIQFNKELFSRLESFDIALLLLHEAVYVLGEELDHDDSYNVRKLVTFLLAKDIRNIVYRSEKTIDHRKFAHEFRDYLRSLNFGNFAHLFRVELKTAVKNRTANRKQLAYSNYLKKNPFPKLTRFWDAPLWLTDEQAFMLYWYFYGGPGGAFNQNSNSSILSLEEYIASPNEELDQVKRVCDLMKLPGPKLGSLDQSKAERHCKAVLN